MDNYEELKNKYPDMFGNVRCGYSAPEGWSGVINELSEKLNTICEKTGVKINVSQVKEKFGCLRFYIDIKSNKETEWTSPFIHAIINRYESQCWRICQSCGEYGHPYGGDYRATLCEKHGAERKLTKLD